MGCVVYVLVHLCDEILSSQEYDSDTEKCLCKIKKPSFWIRDIAQLSSV